MSSAVRKLRQLVWTLKKEIPLPPAPSAFWMNTDWSGMNWWEVPEALMIRSMSEIVHPASDIASSAARAPISGAVSRGIAYGDG
ncbi:MAG: hypothetical protein ACI8RZ_005445 [Myxococcota bacterium]|jgi:hypothetical protein